MCGTAHTVGGVSYWLFIQYFPTLTLGGMAIKWLVLLLQQKKVVGLIPSVLNYSVFSSVSVVYWMLDFSSTLSST